jgi:hypothetical protein
MGGSDERAGEMRKAYNVLVRKSEEAEPLGRNMSRRKDITTSSGKKQSPTFL